MNALPRLCLAALLLLLTVSAVAFDEGGEWAPTPPRLGLIDGEVSVWRPGAEDWVRARPNLALAAGDALYAGKDASFEVQFDSHSFVRADARTQLSLVAQEEHRIQFKLTGGRVSFDLRSVAAGDALEVSTPDAVFVVEHPGYYRVEVGRRDTHFITRRGGEATLITADGRSLSLYPSEEAVVSPGNPVKVATYAAPPPDAWDRWNDARGERIGESASARYLPPGVYGAAELDRYGRWRLLPTYGPVWIPYGVGAAWLPYSTGVWVWDPYYEWTWVDDAPWGWAPFHYGRWIVIDGYWAWAPGPVVRRPVYAPALVAFLIRDRDVAVRFGAEAPGLWWVALSWGEPVLPWWGLPYRRGRPYWGGWGGPRIVNDVVIDPATAVNTDAIRFRNAGLPRGLLTVPADRFGRERGRVGEEARYRYPDLAPVRGELPVKPSRASLLGGAPKGVPPPKDVVARTVVSTRAPRERLPDWQDDATRLRTRDVTESRYVVPPLRRDDARTPQRPPFGVEAGPERPPPPAPPRYREPKKTVPAQPESPPPRKETRRDRKKEKPLPGEPASRVYPGRGQADREER